MPTSLPLILLFAACGRSEGGPGPARAPAGEALVPRIEGKDAGRPQVSVRWVPVAADLPGVTDLQTPPAGGPGPRPLLVAMKSGRAVLLRPEGPDEVMRLQPATRSEQGLLALVFDPDFWTNGHLWAHYTVPGDAGGTSRISRFTVDPGAPDWAAGQERVVFELAQPWANHNGGQLLFDASGMLLVGLGDGGSGGDPLGAGQDRGTLLGKLLRLDVRSGPSARAPADNPFVGVAGTRPEIWALGLRNPWRFSALPDGRLAVADVGQNAWEEVSVVAAGDNLGWNTREGDRCFQPKQGCGQAGLVDPVWVYGHDEGQSVTGGRLYTGSAVPALRGRYVFGDFASGRVWALALPSAPIAAGAAAPTASVTALGAIDANISTFGEDADGELLLADYSGGVVYRMAAP